MVCDQTQYLVQFLGGLPLGDADAARQLLLLELGVYVRQGFEFAVHQMTFPAGLVVG